MAKCDSGSAHFGHEQFVWGLWCHMAGLACRHIKSDFVHVCVLLLVLMGLVVLIFFLKHIPGELDAWML